MVLYYRVGCRTNAQIFDVIYNILEKRCIHAPPKGVMWITKEGEVEILRREGNAYSVYLFDAIVPKNLLKELHDIGCERELHLTNVNTYSSIRNGNYPTTKHLIESRPEHIETLSILDEWTGDRNISKMISGYYLTYEKTGLLPVGIYGTYVECYIYMDFVIQEGSLSLRFE